MNFVEASPLPDPETAARKLIEIANGVEAVQDGPRRRRVAQAPVPFKLGGSPDRYGAGVTGYSATRQVTRDRRRKTLGSVRRFTRSRRSRKLRGHGHKRLRGGRHDQADQ